MSRSNEFIIRMSRDTLTLLKRHLQEKKHSVLLNIIQEHLYFDMYEGVARNKQQIDATAGGMVGEATRQGKVEEYWEKPLNKVQRGGSLLVRQSTTFFFNSPM